MKNTVLYWYPFRSQEVADICAHLTAEESVALRKMALLNGGAFSFAVGLAPFVIMLGERSLFPDAHFWILFVILLTVVLPVFVLLSVPQRKKVRAFLASTVYAQTQGIKAESIRLHALEGA